MEKSPSLRHCHPAVVVYDDFGNLAKEGGPNGTSRRWLYDGNGNILRITDHDNSQYVYKYASWDLRTAAIDPLENTLAFQYTRTQKLSALKDRGGSISQYEHDLKDRLVRIRRHGVVKEQYRYDQADNLIEKLDGNGLPLLSIEIGPGNLRKSKRLVSGQTHSFGYDESGRLLSAATDTAEVLLAYDRSGNRIKDERNGLGVTHRYNAGRNLIEATYFKHFKISYQRFRRGRLSIADSRGSTHTIEALGHGLLIKTLANGSSEAVQFDGDGRCLAKTTRRRRADLWSRSYSYSGEGDLLAVSDSVAGTIRYECDAAHRLVRAELPGQQAQVFERDFAGNLLRQPGLNNVVLMEGNRVASANGDHFEYNERNNLAVRTGRTGTIRYFYDSADMLISVQMADIRWEAEYDALGRRISKTIAGKKTEFYWDRDRIAAELRPGGSIRLYVYPDDVAFTPFMFLEYDSIESAPEDGRGYYIHSDHLGTPMLVEDDSGCAVWKAQSDAYGRAQVDPASTIEFLLRFPGHYFDPETGLHCNGFRYYSPELGRYLQSDPVGISGGPNLYAYTANPLKHVDVLGLCPAGGDGPKTTTNPPGDQEGTDADEEEPEGTSTAGRGDLTAEEIAKLQALANSTGATIHVVGSAASGERRQVGNYDLPLGKDPPDAPGTTRSDIDVLISSEDSLDGGHTVDSIRDTFPDDVDRVLVGDPTPGAPVTTFTPQQGGGSSNDDDEPTNPGFRRPGA